MALTTIKKNLIVQRIITPTNNAPLQLVASGETFPVYPSTKKSRGQFFIGDLIRVKLVGEKVVEIGI